MRSKKFISILLVFIFLIPLFTYFELTINRKISNHSKPVNNYSNNSASASSSRKNLTIGDIDYIQSIVSPPYIEIFYLYKKFPIIIKSNKEININQINLYIIDDYNNLIKLNIYKRENLGISKGIYYYSVTVNISQGFFKPGKHALIVSDGSVGEEYDLMILGPVETYRPNLTVSIIDNKVQFVSTEYIQISTFMIPNCNFIVNNIIINNNYTVSLSKSCKGNILTGIVFTYWNGKQVVGYVPIKVYR